MTWCTSPVSMVMQCRLVSGWGLLKWRSVLLSGLRGLGRALLLLLYYLCFRDEVDPAPAKKQRCGTKSSKAQQSDVVDRTSRSSLRSSSTSLHRSSTVTSRPSAALSHDVNISSVGQSVNSVRSQSCHGGEVDFSSTLRRSDSPPVSKLFIYFLPPPICVDSEAVCILVVLCVILLSVILLFCLHLCLWLHFSSGRPPAFCSFGYASRPTTDGPQTECPGEISWGNGLRFRLVTDDHGVSASVC